MTSRVGFSMYLIAIYSRYIADTVHRMMRFNKYQSILLKIYISIENGGHIGFKFILATHSEAKWEITASYSERELIIKTTKQREDTLHFARLFVTNWV